jgi:hypothetical protein
MPVVQANYDQILSAAMQRAVPILRTELETFLDPSTNLANIGADILPDDVFNIGTCLHPPSNPSASASPLARSFLPPSVTSSSPIPSEHKAQPRSPNNSNASPMAPPPRPHTASTPFLGSSLRLSEHSPGKELSQKNQNEEMSEISGGFIQPMSTSVYPVSPEPGQWMCDQRTQTLPSTSGSSSKVTSLFMQSLMPSSTTRLTSLPPGPASHVNDVRVCRCQFHE